MQNPALCKRAGCIDTRKMSLLSVSVFLKDSLDIQHGIFESDDRILQMQQTETLPLTKRNIGSFLQDALTLMRYVFHRVDEERLFQTAGNIAYTLILSMVPALTVALAIFTRFPQFEAMERTLRFYFMRGMIPPGMAEGIIDNLTSFAANATQVSIIGTLAMVVTTFMLFDLIESSFNRIWGVRESRPFVRRLIIYFFIALFGPLLLGVSLYFTSHLFLATRGIVSKLPFMHTHWFKFFLGGISTVAFTLLYRFVPYRQILWRDAFTGAVFTAIIYEIGKRSFAVFALQFASYEKIYGAIALIPIFFLWLYCASLIMLSGAVLTSLLPDFRSGRWRRTITPGSQYNDALHLIRTLYNAQSDKSVPASWINLQRHVSLSSTELENMLFTMQHLNWVERHRPQIMTLRFLRRKDMQVTLGEWKWTGDATSITLADVYSRFVFEPDEKDELSQRIAGLVRNALDQTLTEYFEEIERAGQNGVA